jgi:predicted DNA-binding transcriptional regulator YafY
MPKADFKTLGSRKKKMGLAKPVGIKDKVINIVDLYALIAQNRHPSVRFLQDRFDISARSVHRYLEIIRMIDPIMYDKEKGGYRFENGNRIKKMSLSKDDFLLLMTLGETVSHLGGPLKTSFQKFTQNFLNAMQAPVDGKLPNVLIKIQETIEAKGFGGYFSVISDCINEMRSIDVVYHALHSGKTTQRRIDPYGLVYYEGAWLLIGYCHLREGVRHFALDMICSLKATNLFFRTKDNFELREHLSGSWGVYDDPPVDLTVRFSPKVAGYILRKDKWHHSEKRKILPSGGVELSFFVAGVDEIRKWIYSWGPDVEVVAPEWFRERMKKEFSELAKRHS